MDDAARKEKINEGMVDWINGRLQLTRTKRGLEGGYPSKDFTEARTNLFNRTQPSHLDSKPFAPENAWEYARQMEARFNNLRDFMREAAIEFRETVGKSGWYATRLEELKPYVSQIKEEVERASRGAVRTNNPELDRQIFTETREWMKTIEAIERAKPGFQGDIRFE